MNPRSALAADRVASTSSPTAADPAHPRTTVAELLPVPDQHPPVSPDRLAARRVIDQAKLLLMAHQQMSEPEAYRWIQKTAMDRRVTMATVAATIISSLGAATPDADPQPATDADRHAAEAPVADELSRIRQAVSGPQPPQPAAVPAG